MTVFVGNTNLLTLVGLRDHITDDYINNAAVTVTIKDAAGTNVTGVTWPLTLPYVLASNGNYRAALSNDLALVAGKKYTAYVEADGGADLVGHWQFKFTAAVRTGVTADS